MDSLAYKEDIYIKQRIELIDNKIVTMSPRPRPQHTIVSDNICFEFKKYLKGKKCIAFSDGVDVYIDEKNRYIPDVMIVCNRDMIKNDGVHGVPDLIVEILSHSTAKNDRTIKKDTYEKAGVKEYWIVDIDSKSIEIYLNENNKFRLDNIYYYYSDDEINKNNALADDDINKEIIFNKIKVSLYDDLYIDVKDVFDNII